MSHQARTPHLPRRRAVTVATLLALLLTATEAASVTAAPKAQPRATATSSPYTAVWAWHSPTAPPSVTDLVKHARTHRLTEIHVAVPWNVAAYPTYLTWLKNLRTTAAKNGITLSALGGDASWVSEPHLAKTWMTGALATGAFTRVHLDVEPWTLPAWEHDPKPLADNYLTMLDTVAAATTAPIDVDMNAFLADTTTSDGRNWLDQVLTRVDGLSILAFRDHATGDGNGILDISASTRAAAVRARVPYRIGVEVAPNLECPTCTFDSAGPAALTREANTVHAALTGTPHYTGIAVQDYQGWVTLTAP